MMMDMLNMNELPTQDDAPCSTNLYRVWDGWKPKRLETSALERLPRKKQLKALDFTWKNLKEQDEVGIEEEKASLIDFV
jgi:hypothetical protein